MPFIHVLQQLNSARDVRACPLVPGFGGIMGGPDRKEIVVEPIPVRRSSVLVDRSDATLARLLP